MSRPPAAPRVRQPQARLTPARPCPAPPAAGHQAGLPPLSEQQQLKLRQLTVISLATEEKVTWGQQRACVAVL
jgi:hypothetical protein